MDKWFSTPSWPDQFGQESKGAQKTVQLVTKIKSTYNTGDSLVVTDPTTSPAVTGLSMGERTGSRVLQYLWSYVFICALEQIFIVRLTKFTLTRSSPFSVQTGTQLVLISYQTPC